MLLSYAKGHDCVAFSGRFNVYQELLLAAAYKVHSFGLAPIMYYVNAVFSLQGVFLAALFSIAWHLSGSWQVKRIGNTLRLLAYFKMWPFVFCRLAGVLTSVYVVVQK